MAWQALLDTINDRPRIRREIFNYVLANKDTLAPDAESSDTVVTPPTGIIGKESVKTGTIMRYMMVNATSYRYLSLA